MRSTPSRQGAETDDAPTGAARCPPDGRRQGALTVYVLAILPKHAHLLLERGAEGLPRFRRRISGVQALLVLYLVTQLGPSLADTARQLGVSTSGVAKAVARAERPSVHCCQVVPGSWDRATYAIGGTCPSTPRGRIGRVIGPQTAGHAGHNTDTSMRPNLAAGS